ncbi:MULTISPECIES: hypothetical protein [unclassified Microcoleus]|uniref:hypothetical protein n=1 Tax=unclassified Microcoleus TaxID=2642155 RepID=UPI002FD01EC2
MSEIHINPMNLFPYDVNRREGTYFDRNGKQIDKDFLKGHYAVAYEGSDIRLSTWAWKQRKELTNLATYFDGDTLEQKRLVIWQQFQTRTVNRHLISFCEKFRTENLYLWYLSCHDLPTAQFIQRFLEWYWSEYPIINS